MQHQRMFINYAAPTVLGLLVLGAASGCGSEAQPDNPAGIAGATPSSAGTTQSAGANAIGGANASGGAGNAGAPTSPSAGVSNAGGNTGASGSANGAAGSSNGAAGSSNGAAGSGNGAAGRGNGTAGSSNGAAGSSNGTAGSGSTTTEKFSFFVTSYAALQRLSGSVDGFGGNLTYGETGAGSGLRGADKICTQIAEASLKGSGSKGWRAFLSAANGGNGSPVNAIDRIGTGPWYDRLGRLFGNTVTDINAARPTAANAAIKNDFPNEDGVPNHQPDPTKGEVDNHDILTGSDEKGKLFAATATCLDWTAAVGDTAKEGKPRVGHSWPRSGGGGMIGGGMTGGGSGAIGDTNNWMSALTESGCKAGVNLIETGPPQANQVTVGSGGGYGGFYCFALKP